MLFRSRRGQLLEHAVRRGGEKAGQASPGKAALRLGRPDREHAVAATFRRLNALEQESRLPDARVALEQEPERGSRERLEVELETGELAVSSEDAHAGQVSDARTPLFNAEPGGGKAARNPYKLVAAS